MLVWANMYLVEGKRTPIIEWSVPCLGIDTLVEVRQGMSDESIEI